MHPDIISLKCRNFRSYKRLALRFSSKFVVFFGDNGAGKTNILEAISLFSSDRGLRKAPLADLNTIDTQSGSWNLDMTVQSSGYCSYLSTCAPAGRRVGTIDNSTVGTLSKLEEVVWILWMVPSMDNIFINPISERRSFFDHLVNGYTKHHKISLKKISSLQKERLHIIFHRQNDNWLNAIEQKLAEEYICVTKNRLEFLQVLRDTFEKYSSEFLRPIVEISGVVENIYITNSEENAALEIADVLKRSRYEDSEKQLTSIGTHKTSWDVYHSVSRLEATNCSTGEQKAFLISLVLASLRIYKNIRDGIPVLLLDDLMMHLDKNRRKHLVDELISIDVQTFLTGTDAELFEDFGNLAQLYHIQNSICNLYLPDNNI